ncbi:MAG TPA: peroxiredoxin-like family protein [Terriglobales bacterium]|nr:peroxiredoxin-like family protein [Terriglobales bacterium]
MKWRSLEESKAGTDTRSLRERYAERKALIAQHVPSETQAVHERVIAELKGSGVAGRALPVGAQAPAFELKDQDDRTISSLDLLGSGRLVVCFFRGRWCPFCVGQMEAMNAVFPWIEQAGASFLAISPQTVKQSFFMADQHNLQFPLLSDGRNQVARQFGLVYRVPEEQQAICQRVFINLPFVNGDDTWELPIPATYILERDSTVSYASVDPDYTERPEPTEIVRKLAELR